MGPTWVLSAPGGPHVGPMNLAIREMSLLFSPDIPAAASAEEMRLLLETASGIGSLDVSRSGTCAGYTWDVHWISAPGDQPQLVVVCTITILTEPMAFIEIDTGGFFRLWVMCWSVFFSLEIAKNVYMIWTGCPLYILGQFYHDFDGHGSDGISRNRAEWRRPLSPNTGRHAACGLWCTTGRACL